MIVSWCLIASFLGVALSSLCDLSACGPLQVSSNGHYLSYADGSPFYYVADTPWHMMQDLNQQDCESLIDKRLEQGFTALQLSALGLGDNENANGDKYGSWSELSEPYWQFQDAVLKYMESKGMVAYMVAVWEYNWRPSAEDHYTYGKILGNRWKDAKNIIWVLGGDVSPAPVDKYSQLLAGIRAGGAKQLVSAHVAAPGSSSSIMPDDLDFFSIQSRAGRSGDTAYTGELAYSDFVKTFDGKSKPTIMVETWYEVVPGVGGGVCNLHKSRSVALREAYWGNRIAGSFGEGYGAWGLWYSAKQGQTINICGDSGTTEGWQHDVVAMKGADDIATHMKRIMLTLPWSSLEPDGGKAVQQPSGMYVARSTLEDVPTVLVYTTHAQAFTLNTDVFKTSSVYAQYYDPSGGEQAKSSAFPVVQIDLNGSRVTVPAHSWVGDAAIVIRPIAKLSMVI